MIVGLLIALMVPGPMAPGWDAAMCLPGRSDPPRYYFSACEPRAVDWEGFCSRFGTRFSVRTGLKTSKEECLDAVRQNHPNMRRYRDRKQPLICDFNIEGPLPSFCYGP